MNEQGGSATPFREGGEEVTVTSLRVTGHTLWFEGRGHNADGEPRYGLRGYLGYDRGKCSCGVLSEPLPSAAARKRWHREHKQEVLKEAEQIARLERELGVGE